MAACDGSVTPEQYALHRPALDTQAGSIMESLRGMNAGELAAAVKRSLPMARRLVRMIYDFPDKRLGGEAIEAFTGVVFRAFGYRSLDDDARRRACGHVRIVSSLYGWLRPDDIVKPYRFDFTTALAPGGRNFAAYWREYVTGCLLDELEACGATEVLNLLPGDAARCIDWKRVGAAATVWKADFREAVAGETFRTPNSNRLKTLRGELLRQIVCDGISSAGQLMTAVGDNYIGEGSPQPGTLLFTTA